MATHETRLQPPSRQIAGVSTASGKPGAPAQFHWPCVSGILWRAGHTGEAETDKRRVTVSDTVLYEKEGHIVTITYNRPERMNAINGPMREALNAAWLRFRDDTDAWVAILTGTGRAFCAGADVRDGGSA